VPVRNSQTDTSLKKSSAGMTRETTIPTVVSTDTSAARRSTPMTTASPLLGLRDRSMPSRNDGEPVVVDGLSPVVLLVIVFFS